MATNKGSVFIYALVDPVTGHPGYVGASGDPDGRLHQHQAQARFGTSAKCLWIRSIWEAGLKPLLAILEVTDIASWRTSEEAWIVQLRAEGHALTNYETKAPLIRVDSLGEAFDDTDYLSVRQAATLKEVSWQAIYRAIKDGRLPAVEVGEVRLIRRGDLNAWRPRKRKQKGSKPP